MPLNKETKPNQTKPNQTKPNLTLERRSNLSLVNKKKRTWHLVDFAVPEGHRVKIKERETINTNRELKKER